MSLWWRHNIYLWRHNGARRRARQTLRIFHVGKLHPNHSCILIQESFWITIHLYLVKRFKIESSDIFQILEYFENFDVYFINRYLTVWGFTIVFPQVPIFRKLLDFSIHLLIPEYGQFVTIKTPQDEFSFGKTLFQPETTYFTHKDDFSWQGTDPQMSPIGSEWYSQSDRRKILEPPWSVLDT